MNSKASFLVVATSVGLAFSGGPAAAERAPIRTEGGTCIPGPHDTGRLARLPGVAAMSDRHLERHEDAYVHCGPTEPVRAQGSQPPKRQGR